MPQNTAETELSTNGEFWKGQVIFLCVCYLPYELPGLLGDTEESMIENKEGRKSRRRSGTCDTSTPLFSIVCSCLRLGKKAPKLQTQDIKFIIRKSYYT